MEALIARIKALTGALSKTQLLTLALTFLGVVGLVVGSAVWLSTPDYRLLFADMDAESAAQITAKLDADKVPYRLDEGGRTIRVPAERVDRLKIDLASSVTSGRIGFEIFDRTAFGQTEFLEQVNYRRALEGELARTIATISEVASARVHLAMAKDSLFGARQQAAKASVILKLRSNRPLSAASVQGITNLVAASVEGLRPDAVVLIDNFGRPLSQARESGGPMAAEQLERQQSLERDMTEKVVNLLEPVVGVGRVRVNVSARLSNDTQEQTEELFDPNAVVRSRQTTTEGAPSTVAQGVAGARGNLPQPVAPSQNPAINTASTATAGPGTLASRSSETTNYEVSKVTRVTQKPRGDVARLSVAVLLDHEQVATKNADGTVAKSTKPRDPADLQKIQELVSAAVGLDTNRGDLLTVENIAFSDSMEEDVTQTSWWRRLGPMVTEILKVLVVVGLGVMAFLVFVRPIVQQTTLAIATPRVSVATAGPGGVTFTTDAMGMPQQELPKTIEDLEGEIEAQLELAAAKASDPRINVLSKRVQRMSEENPEYAAKLLRTWMDEDRRR